MTRKKQLRALVSDRLAAAAEEILSGAERLLEMSLEQQRAVVHQRLSLVADNIFGMLETLMDEYEAEISSSHQDMDHLPQPAERTDICTADRLSRSTCAPREQPSSSSPQQSKDVSEETESQLISAEASRLGETQRAAKGDTTMTEQCGLSPRFDQEPSSDNSEAVCDDSDGTEEPCEKPLRSLKRKTLRYSREKKKEKWRRSPTEQIQLTGQSGCRVCGKVFRYKRSFLKHLLQHEQSSDLCGVCGKHLDSGESLKVHLQTHSKEHESRLQREAESDEDWKESEGSDDGEEYVKRQCKGDRNKDSSNLKYSCKVCGKSFCYRASFLKHVQEDERDADLCGVCGKRFHSKESLRLHLQTYIPTNDCEVCGKHFDGHQQLEMHTRTHTGEKPYICTICGKAFAQNGNLKAHMRVHTGERPYPCTVCGQSFGFKEYMLAHMRIHTGEKPFLCSVCGKGFRQRGSLRTHMIMHTGQSKHHCIVCDKKFYKSGALKIHMRSHTGERPYLCNVCGKGFTASGSLNKHMAVHQGERSHGCGACGKRFLRREDLRRHADTHQEGSSQLTTL